MEANELMIGNYVGATFPGNVIPELTGIDKNTFDANGFVPKLIESSDIDNAHWYFPIPLTEEWLFRFGFNKDDHGFIQKETENINWMMRIGNNLKWTSSTFGIQVDLKYVHQLQNLYFALTGEELNLIA